jgi:hypothetical protein
MGELPGEGGGEEQCDADRIGVALARDRARDAGQQDAGREHAPQREPVPEHEPREQQRVGGLHLKAQHGVERRRARGAEEEEQVRNHGAECAEQGEPPCVGAPNQRPQLPLTRQHDRCREAREAGGRGRDEERIAVRGDEPRDRRHEGPGERAQTGEAEPRSLALSDHLVLAKRTVMGSSSIDRPAWRSVDGRRDAGVQGGGGALRGSASRGFTWLQICRDSCGRSGASCASISSSTES